MGKDEGREATTPRELAEGILTGFPKRNRDLFHYLITTFQSMLPSDKATQFALIADELERAIVDNCQTCSLSQSEGRPQAIRDPRRSRFLLRLVVGRVSHLFSGDHPSLPRSLIEGLDRYLKKAFGEIIYEELNSEADGLLYSLNVNDDEEMWRRIQAEPAYRRFVHIVFIRILFRFENFSHGKKVFNGILSQTMQEFSHFDFQDKHFSKVFESLFSHLWVDLETEENRVRWDFQFGDGASKRIETVLRQGLEDWLKRRDKKVLGSGRVVGGPPVMRKSK